MSIVSKLVKKAFKKPGRWMLGQIIGSWSLEKIIDLAIDLIWKSFGKVTIYLDDLVAQAENKFPDPKSGKLKFEWVAEILVRRFEKLATKGKKRIVNWLIEMAVVRMADECRDIALIADKLS